MGEGSTKFFVGAAVGAGAGFAAGVFFATPAARTVREHTLAGLSSAGRFLGRSTVKVADALGLVLEAGYTRLRGQERYLEHEIEELRRQISRLEQQRMD